MSKKIQFIEINYFKNVLKFATFNKYILCH